MAKRPQILQKIGTEYDGSGVQKAEKSMDKLGKESKQLALGMSSSFSAIKVAAAAGIGLAVNAVKNAVVDYARATDKLAKDSRAIGVSTESWQKLTYAADRQGVSQEMLYGSMKKFGRAMGQIKTGAGGVASALEKSNPALFAQLKAAKNNEEAFLIAADAIKAIEDPSERAAASMQIFGESGTELNKIFEAGSQGIKALMDEQEAYGVVSTEQANQSESFIDAMTKLNTAMKGFSSMLMSAIVPALTPMIEAVAKWVAMNKPLIQGLAKLLGILIKITPYILLGVGVYKAITTGVMLYTKAQFALNVATKAMASSQAILNAVMSANPISLIAAAVAVAVAVLVLLIQNFDKVVAAVKRAGRAITDFFSPDNLIGGIKAIGRGLKQFFLNPLESIKNGFAAIWEFCKKILGLTKKDSAGVGDIEAPAVESTPLMAQEQEAKLNEARYVSETRSSQSIDINFNNLPKGVDVQQSAPVPGVTLKLGYAGS